MTKEEIAEEAAHLITITDMEFNADVTISEKLRIKESVKSRVLAALKELEEQHKSSKVRNPDATSSELHEHTGEWTDWSNDIPIKPGEYLFRSDPDDTPRFIKISTNHNGEITFDVNDAMRVFDRKSIRPQWSRYVPLISASSQSATETKGKEKPASATGVESASQTCLLPMPEGLDLSSAT